MSRMKCLFRSTAGLIALTFLIPAFGQTKTEELFAAVPAERRERFAERLHQYVEYTLIGDHKNLLKLYAEETLCSLCIGKQKCIEDCRPPMKVEVLNGFKSVLVEFKPIEGKPYPYDGIWNFYIDV